MPQRIQRKRTKGWRMPEGAVYVGRPTKWGNPFVVVPAASHRGGPGDMWGVLYEGRCLVRFDVKRDALTDAVDRFRRLMRGPWADRQAEKELLETLRGKDLACWCAIGLPCHADVLLELANR